MSDKVLYATKSLTDYANTDVEGIGRIRQIAGKMYRWVRNDTGAALAKGDVVYHGSASTDALERKCVFVRNQSEKGTLVHGMAGVALSAIPKDGYGWIQIYGYCPEINVMGHANLAVGTILGGVDDQKYVTYLGADNAAPACKNHIIAMEAWTTTSAAIKKGYVNCL